MENQQKDQEQQNQPQEQQQQFGGQQDQNQQRIQQLEAVASHYTQAANYLRRNDEEACVQCIQKGQEAAQSVNPTTSTAFTRPNPAD